jgi:tripartite-type tricarboxylate transporter receptor subunit TctC
MLKTILAATLAAVFVSPLQAQETTYPTRSVSIIVPFSAGGTADIFARLAGTHLQQKWGQAFITENVPGAGSIIGINRVAKGAPDGSILGLGSTSGLAINPSLYGDKLSYKPEKELIPIVQVSMVPNALVVNPDKIKARSVKELIEYMKANPGKLSYGSAGIGTSQHLAAELFQQMTGTKMEHIPYRGSSAMMNDLLSGKIDLAFDNVPLLIPHAKDGKLVLLASATEKRAEFDPNLPTVAETLPGFEAVAWHGFFAPAGTPKPVIDKLSKEIIAFMNMPETQKKFRELGAVPVAVPPAEFAAYIALETERWKKVIESAKITAQAP